MKKLLMLIIVFSTLSVKAQYYETLNVEEEGFSDYHIYCFDDNVLGLIIFGETNCSNQWYVFPGDGSVLEWSNVDSITIYNSNEFMPSILVQYNGCSINTGTEIRIQIPPINSFTEQVLWKRQGEDIVLNAECNNTMSYVWSTGESTPNIEVSEPGIYSVTLTNECGPATYSVEVRDNVEIYRATTDLVTNLNQVTWNTTPEQSEYITAVKVYRNNELVGTVPYTDGVFTDNMGSENTQWQYHIVGVSVEGDDCPIPSYWKRTIHLDRVLGAQGQYILQWTPYEEESPAKDEVTAYGIYDVVNGVPNHVIDVGYFTNVYAYNPADFHGYGAVAAIFAEKGLEELAFSNLTKELLTSVGENPIAKMSIYPNPANGEFTVDGPQTLTIFNTMGQVVATSYAENGVHTISLSSAGVYFVKSGEGIVRKVVVK